MASETRENNQSVPVTGVGLRRRGLLRFGTLITALTGASAISALGTNGAHAATAENPPTDYVPIAQKGAASGVATLDLDAKIPSTQLPDLSATYGLGKNADENIAGAKTFTSLMGLRSTTWFGLGAGVGSARNPVYINQVVDGGAISNTLTAGGGDDYVGFQTNIKFEGGFAALKTIAVGNMTAGSKTLTLTSGTFSSPVIPGYTANVTGAGVGGWLPVKSKILSITDSTHAELADAASTTVNNVQVVLTLAADHNFLFAANDFYTTGTAAGAIAGIDNLFGRLTELHLNTQDAVLNSIKATSSELDIDASAKGSIIGSAVAHEISAIRNDAGATITNSYGLLIHGATPANTTNPWALYVNGGGKSKFTGPTTLSGTAATDVPLVIQLPLGTTGEALQMFDYTLTNKRFHVANSGSVASSNFLTAFEGLSAQTAIGAMTSGFAGIRMGISGVEIAQTAPGVASVRGAGKAFGIPSVPSNNRVTAATAGAGALCHDSTLNRVIYSDGTNWKDVATGAPL